MGVNLIKCKISLRSHQIVNIKLIRYFDGKLTTTF